MNQFETIWTNDPHRTAQIRSPRGISRAAAVSQSSIKRRYRAEHARIRRNSSNFIRIRKTYVHDKCRSNQLTKLRSRPRATFSFRINFNAGERIASGGAMPISSPTRVPRANRS
jgi:hypothetical protein